MLLQCHFIKSYVDINFVILKVIFGILQFLDQLSFYLPLDIDFLLDHYKTDVDFLSRNWQMLGRPTIIFMLSSAMLGVPI